MNRLVRRFAAIAAMAALVFAQLSVSAFACPVQADTPDVASVEATLAMDNCDEAANPNLCERHCDYGSSSVAHSAPSMPALHVGDFLSRVDTPVARSVSRVVLDRQHLASHPPPPLILLGVLRI
jgi:hypothetical protein